MNCISQNVKVIVLNQPRGFFKKFDNNKIIIGTILDAYFIK